ncbi:MULTISPECIES: haloacid dehalogenase type II [unclassified Agarivorans]|uniref:haloacid dehalogenase type II n=1 Tax=unclassified Agarivorans TaxID=2636026 RepID=UPI0026E2AEA4|nr:MULTISPECIES: haloacid dehalogenase type II [unclassified Agarivorans]MDO6683912.1 haloacid dehalogenase type II [Agarivorans sp. 3_MG-2023]MDO6714355.1 haloacid dehalogenase type II [Agarivorans sp. 2_MG-2023]
MTMTLAFDVYGTLIDTRGVEQQLQALMGEQAPAFSQMWRDKQLEYSFRRGLMQNYQSFAVCTAQALDYCCQAFQIALTAEQKQSLLDVYKVLPAHADVKQGLTELQGLGFKMFAFSNGKREAVELLLKTAGIDHLFLSVVSADDVQSFKPNPAVYAYFLQQANTTADKAWLISSNPFDVTGAISAGMQAAWIQRSKQTVFDPWEIQAKLVVASLTELAESLPKYKSAV